MQDGCSRKINSVNVVKVLISDNRYIDMYMQPYGFRLICAGLLGALPTLRLNMKMKYEDEV